MYRISKGQSQVPTGQVRYDLDARIDGKRRRCRVVCRPQDVNYVHDRWLAGLYGHDELPAIKMYEAIEMYLVEYASNKSPKQSKTEAAFFEKFKELIPDFPLAAFGSRHVAEYLFKRRKDRRGVGYSGPLTASSMNKDINILSSFTRWATHRGYYDKPNPCQGYRESEDNERHVHPTPVQVRELLELARDHEILVPVSLSVLAGLRLNEILTLTWDDVDFQARRLFIRAEETKSRRHRAVPICDELLEILQEVKDDGQESVAGHTHQTLRRRWRRLREGISWAKTLPDRRLHFHDLRHVFAQSCRDAGIDLGDVSAFLGHADTRTTTRRYAQAGGYDAVNKVNKLGRHLKEK